MLLSSYQKHQIYCTSTSNPQQCHQCILKQKYVPGVNSKCFKHMFELKQQEIDKIEFTVFDQIMESLNDIIGLMPEYNSELTFVPRDQSLSQITEIVDGLDKIKESLTLIKRQKKQSETSVMNYSVSDSFRTVTKNSKTKLKEQQNTSDKTPSVAFSVHSESINQHIKKWVGYFASQLVFPTSKRKSVLSMQLPFEDVIEMQMFKQSVNKKYEEFMKKIDEKDRLLNEAINKLADYIDKNEKVSSSREKRGYQNVFSNSSRLMSPVTPMRALQLSQTRSGGSSSKQQNRSRQKSKSKKINPFKISASSFTLDNQSCIFPNDPPNENIEEAYMMLTVQAQTIQKLLQDKFGMDEKMVKSF